MMRAMDPAPTFGQLLEKYIEASSLTQEAFAKKCGMSRGHPANLISGARTPKLEKVDKIAAILHLDDVQRDQLKEAALMAHSPPDVARLIADLRWELAKLEKQNALLQKQGALLQKQNALIVAELHRAGVQLPKKLGDG